MSLGEGASPRREACFVSLSSSVLLALRRCSLPPENGHGHSDVDTQRSRARHFWDHFGTLTTISRPSRQEEPVIEHVRAWASHHGYELQQDSGRNLVIRVHATPGRE
jgi:hypothetical protein